jgi:hypothetical protein
VVSCRDLALAFQAAFRKAREWISHVKGGALAPIIEEQRQLLL